MGVTQRGDRLLPDFARILSSLPRRAPIGTEVASQRHKEWSGLEVVPDKQAEARAKETGVTLGESDGSPYWSGSQ